MSRKFSYKEIINQIKNIICKNNNNKKLVVHVFIVMYRSNYLGQSISVCRATNRKMQSLLKDRARKILFSRDIQKSPL
jgi:hypothetical protein